MKGWTALHGAVMYCSDGVSSSRTDEARATTLKMLISAKADVNAQSDEDGSSPLHVAAYFDTDWDVLLASGATHDIKDKLQHTPLWVAQSLGKPEPYYAELDCDPTSPYCSPAKGGKETYS